MNNLDRAISQALGGQSVDSELSQLRASFENSLKAARNAVEEQYADAEAQRTELEADEEAFADPGTNLSLILTAARLDLLVKAKALQCAEYIREAFRLRHGLNREAQTPQTVASLLFLAILVFVEGAINAGFFHTAHMAASPITALLVSLMISVTNVAVCTCAGYFIGRYLDYGIHAADADAFRAIRMKARCLFFVFLGVVGFLHITVGLVRSQETLDAVQHGLSGYIGLVTTPEAVFLVLTGACMSVLSYHKSLHAFDDPYPGYGERQRAVEAAYDELTDLFEELSGQIEGCCDDVLKDMERANKSRQKAIDRHRQSVHDCQSARRDLGQAVAEAQSQLRTEVTRLDALYRSVPGDHKPLSEKALDRLCDFQSFLEGCEPPPFYRQPDHAAQKQRLEKARSDALKQLNALFQEALHSTSGETS